MKYITPNIIWQDIRSSVAEYTANELLSYYRSAKSYSYDREAQERENIPPEVCRAIFQRVDSIISTMRCSTDYKVVLMARILDLEYCCDPTDTTSKVASVGISKTTYYKYYHEAKLLFSEFVDRLNKYH